MSLGVQQGFPRDKNNFAPRVGFAWDIQQRRQDSLRGAYGLFYDHPLLAVAFNSDIADASQQQQYFNVLPGSPAPNQLLNCFKFFKERFARPPLAMLLCRSPAIYDPGRRDYRAISCRDAFASTIKHSLALDRFFPFTLGVAQDFQYAYANQANLTIERQLTKNMSFSASYIFVGAHHLPHPRGHQRATRRFVD